MKAPNLTILETQLTLRPDDPKVIMERMMTNMESRKAKQPLEFPSAGSTFKRPEGRFVGQMTEECGLKGYTGTNSGIEISERVKNGDTQAELAYRGFAYQVAKEIGAASAVLKGKVDTIILTGGFAFDKELMGWISEYVSFVAPVTVYPGEDEMQALAQGGIRVLKGEEEAQTY
jgi:butyrate kinase